MPTLQRRDKRRLASEPAGRASMERPWRNEGKKTLMEGSGVREERITFGLFPEHELLLWAKHKKMRLFHLLLWAELQPLQHLHWTHTARYFKQCLQRNKGTLEQGQGNWYNRRRCLEGYYCTHNLRDIKMREVRENFPQSLSATRNALRDWLVFYNNPAAYWLKRFIKLNTK